MFAFHHDRKRYFDMQYRVSTESILPLIEGSMRLRPGFRVLEVGCGEGGVLKAFARRGCSCVGVDPDGARIRNGRRWLQAEGDPVLLLEQNIFAVSLEQLGGAFDLILLKDVLGEIREKERLFAMLNTLLKPWGQVFASFSPWQMPFGGQQQLCSSGLSRLPWLHLLPRALYRYLLQKNGEPCESLLALRDARISIEGFRQLARQHGFSSVREVPYLLNPMYTQKFGWPGCRQPWPLRHLPYLRNFLTTSAYFVVRKNVAAAQPAAPRAWSRGLFERYWQLPA
ncbi:class I SAM-dependent methyltransferase [Flaviaesturariibacter amylovorans]|uniref:Class I SAM-dependent methyltransferase n=1 Tax=Flaviaesturariibacter amylovorans TaxID=1084520 RepID=A0ABP8GIE8_9BACT